MEETSELRRYQSSLENRVFRAWKKGSKNILMQLPTGGGKTSVFSSIAQKFISKNLKVLVVAHKEELVLQNAKSLEKWCNSTCGLIKAGYKPDYSLNLQSSSIQSLINRWDLIGNLDLIIIDEAHRSPSNIYSPLFDFPDPKILGVTATPIRNDKKEFADLYDVLVPGIQTRQLIKRGYLSDYRFFADRNAMKWQTAKIIDGDFSASDIAGLNDIVELSSSVVKNYQSHGENGTCLVFAVNVEHSLRIVEAYNRAGISAIHLDANSTRKYRREVLKLLADGSLKIISNVALFGEGLDIPGLNCVQIVRPTQSLGLHLQMLGRVLRKSAGKEYAILLDHTDNYQRLGFADDDRHWSLDRTPIIIGNRRDDRSAGNPPNAYEIQKIDLIEITAATREAEREKQKNIEREERKRQREAERQKKAALKLQEEQAAQRKQEEEQLKLRRETLEAEARAKAEIQRQQEQEAALKARKQRELEDIARKEAEVKRQHKIAQQTFLDQRARRQKDREFAAELETRKIMEKLRAEQLKDDEECEAILKERKILEIDQLEMEENARRRHLALVNLHKKQKWERIRAMVNEESREEAIDRLKEIDDHQYSWFTQSLLLTDLDTPGIKALIRFYYDVDYNSSHGKHYAEDLWNFIIGQLIRYENEGVRNKKWATDLLEKMPTPKGVWERIAVAFEYKPGWVHYKTR
jgi:superfamily II DNA or RNA helicase